MSHAVSGGDYGANGVSAAPVGVTVTDDETPSTAVTLSVSPASLSESAGATGLVVTGELDASRAPGPRWCRCR